MPPDQKPKIILPDAPAKESEPKPPLRAKRCETCDGGLFPNPEPDNRGLCLLRPPRPFIFLMPNPKAVSATGAPVVEPIHLSSRPQITREEYCVEGWAPREVSKEVH